MRLTAGNSPDALDHSAVTRASQFQKEPTRQRFAAVGQRENGLCPVTVCQRGGALAAGICTFFILKVPHAVCII